VTTAFDMREVPAGSLTPFGCANPSCGTIVPAKQIYIVDEILQRGYCTPCGQRLRYHRKKWAERGEVIPRTLDEVEERFRRQP